MYHLYVMRNESDPLLVLTDLLMMKTTLPTDEGQELYRANLSLAMKSFTTSENITAHSEKGVGNDVMNKAFSQISKSLFTHRIEGAKLPWRFHQPTFLLYNSRSNPVEHVS